MKSLRLFVVGGLLVSMMGLASPAYANDCSNPKQQCGGCELNPNFSLQDPRPVRCYPT